MPEIKISTKIDNKGLQTGLNAAKGQVDKFDKSISKSGGGGIFGGIMPTFDLSSILSAAAGFLKSMVGYGAELADNLERAGVSAGSFQKFETISMRNAGSTEDLLKSLEKLRDAQGEVINGSQSQIEAFGRLGISEKEVASLSIDELYQRIAKAFVDSGQSASAYSDVMAVLGKTAKNLIPSFEEISSLGGQQFTEMSDKSIAALDALSDHWAEVWTNMKRSVSSGLGNVVQFFAGKGGWVSEKDIEKQISGKAMTAQLQREANIKALADRQKKDAEEKAQKESDKAQKVKASADKKIAEIRADAAEKQKEIADRFEERKDSIRVQGTQTDTLSQMGASVGAGSNPAIAAAQRQVELQKIQNDLAKEQLKALKDVAQKIDKVGGLEP